ncbi:TatD family hydrolase [endosymbiont GvMRE of Glomus versiforme]|uniref:TatD family hydrolase n=1 Tax=endosymbiont GvMRE of Glomus versiforme TaxID=2039283 RepID=UPI000EC13B56|nr:TatD family hydrolase [endosymbiont GvMRE of Glomus versiforme]RHZ36784.1 Hydrolase, TatD family protein [endosymbiont GvMRE of Glomus versiforme]
MPVIIFDTHCHLADKGYKNHNASKIISEAEKVGVKYILNVGQDMPTNQLLLTQLKEFSNLYGALGLHPNSKEDLKEENFQWIENQLTNKKIIAIGEIGLDYYRTFTPQETQKYWFKKQLELAKKHNLPVLLHIRGKDDKKEFIKAFWDAYEIVKEVEIKKGILHCFTGDWEIAQKFINLGFYVSFAGNITYKNAKWKEKWGEAIEKMPLEKIVIETDAPYLVPEPLRGKQTNNYPQNIIHTLKKIAEIRKIKVGEAGEKIYFNTCEFFGSLIKISSK